MFLGAFFAIAKIQKQPKSTSRERMDKQIGIYPYNGIQHSNKDTLLIHTILKNLKIILNERSQAEREREYTVLLYEPIYTKL